MNSIKKGFFFLSIVFIGIGIIGGKTILKASVASSEFKFPYFSSTKSKKVNVRKGPGSQYPVVAVLTTQQPVKLIGEQTIWRKIQAHGEIEGWVHKNMLSSKNRYAIVTRDTILYSLTNPQRPIARVQEGALMKVHHCDTTYCSVSSQENHMGYIPQLHLFGVGEKESIK